MTLPLYKMLKSDNIDLPEFIKAIDTHIPINAILINETYHNKIMDTANNTDTDTHNTSQIITPNTYINNTILPKEVIANDEPEQAVNTAEMGTEAINHIHLGGYSGYTYEDTCSNNMYSVLPNTTIADSGADIDTISDTLTGITDTKPVHNTYIKGVTGINEVHNKGSCKHLEGLDIIDGIINTESDINCLSVPIRTSQGWLFWAKNDKAQLINPSNKAYNFKLDEGLYKLTDNISEGKFS